jgi:hypothetical protein
MIESLEALASLMRQDGAVRIYAKKLAPNDNSKNQIYLGGDFSVLNIIPHGEVRTDDAELAGSVRDRAKADLRFFWIDSNGLHAAPNAQLILYPKYPEVRMSGFLKECSGAPSEIMRVRDEGRVLFLGITHDGRVLGHAAAAGSPLALALYARQNLRPAGVFLELPDASGVSSRDRLLAALTAIYHKHWIRSQKLGRDGVAQPYSARNGGGSGGKSSSTESATLYVSRQRPLLHFLRRSRLAAYIRKPDSGSSCAGMGITTGQGWRAASILAASMPATGKPMVTLAYGFV